MRKFLSCVVIVSGKLTQFAGEERAARRRGPARPAGRVDITTAHRDGRLKRGIAAREDRVADAKARQEAPHAAADHVLVIERVGEAETRLERIPHVNVRI